MELGLPLTRAAGTARPGGGIQETLVKKGQAQGVP